MMMPINLPYHKQLHKWIGYCWDVNAIAVWWEKGKLTAGDGFNELTLEFTSSWMRLETAPGFSKELRALDYGKYQDKPVAEEAQHVVILDKVTETFYYTSKIEALHWLAVYNKDKALTLDSYGMSALNKVKKLARWNTHEPELVDVMKDIYSKVYRRPSYEEFDELCEWVERTKRPSLTVVDA